MKKFNVAWLTTNRTCNNNCSWCYARKKLSTSTIMDIKTAKKAVDELKRRNVKKIILIGGEPTVYPHLVEFISYIHSKNIKIHIASNGRMFKDLSFAQKIKDAGADYVDTSIKGITEQEYFENTNANGYSEMLQGYQNLRKVGIKATASYVITSNSREKFDKAVSFFKKSNFESILLEFVKPTLGLDNKEDIMKIDEMGEFVSYIYNRMKQTNINYVISISFPVCTINQEVWDNLVKEERVSSCCHVPKGSGIVFDENFKVLPCNYYAEFPFSENAIDFNKENSIDILMNSDVVKQFRAKARTYPSEKCITCDKWNYCGGGCFTRWLIENPNDYIK